MPTHSHPSAESAPVANNGRSSTVKEAGRFGLVGVLNTLIDFGIATVIAGILGGATIYFDFFGFTLTGVIIASIIGGCIAMMNSYVLNMRFTFKARDGGLRQALLFFAITGFGLIVLRPIVIHSFTDWWTVPVDLVYLASQALNLPFSRDLIFELVGVGAGIIVVWPYNFYLYKRVVFKKGQA